MKYPVSFFVIILITFCFNIAKSETLSIAYINMDEVMNESLAGKSIVEQLDKVHQGNISEFSKAEEKLKNKEAKLLAQKNILSAEEYEKKISLLKKEIDSYKKDRQEKINFASKIKVEGTSKLLKQINPILATYSKEKGISIIFSKKDIVIARSDLDITKQIIELVNSKIKKIDLN